MFAEEIGKIDQGFFLRLAESRYHPDDKKLPLPYTLFSDKTYTDKDYHKAFPTIFHLRKDLIEKKERFDIRLVYLAIHHIIKNRGHFLFEGQSMSNIPSFSEAFQQLQQSLRDELELDFSCLSVKEVEKTLLSRDMRKSDKKAELIRLFSANARDDESKQKQAFIGLVLGTPVKIDALFPELDLEEADTVKIDFSSGKFEEEYDQLAATLGDKILCVDRCKAIYDWALLAEIRKNARYLSEGKARAYDKHKSDLHAEMLKRVFFQTEIVYVKAGNVSDFRHKFDLVKVREINDFHHARDAYLNIVVGNVYNTRFTHSPLNFIREREGKNYNLRKIYDFDVVRNGVVAWKTTGDETIARVKRGMQKNNILFTRYAIARHGGLFDQNILKKRKGQLPVKGSDPRLTIEKYGGYNNVAGACFMLVEHDTGSGKKARRSRTIEVLPIHLARKISSDKKNGLDYCVHEIGLRNPRILLPAIKMNALFVFDGARMHLTGRSNDRLEFKGAHQLCVCNDSERYIKKILKYQNRCREARRPLAIDSHDGITLDGNLKSDIPLHRV